MSRALMSLPIVNPIKVERRVQDQGELGLRYAPNRVAADADRLAGPTTRLGVALKKSSGRFARYTRS